MDGSGDAARTADALLGVVGLVRRRSRRAVGRPLVDAGLTGSQIELVRTVRREPGIGVAESAERLGLAANSVSTLVRQLADVGVVRRETDPGDRRAVRLHLSEHARRDVEAWRDRRIVAVVRAIEQLDPADRVALGPAIDLFGRLGDLIEVDGAEEGVA
ncbi:MarR family winged helix-turn-helix transcriptional regulator [Tsukamurella soli]|uniref:MarR family transcriptional regulator n=1 Tax=Tsukamurella soli TaxID=644556 RepID=A0ABP8J442_9ACTN